MMNQFEYIIASEQSVVDNIGPKDKKNILAKSKSIYENVIKILKWVLWNYSTLALLFKWRQTINMRIPYFLAL